MGHSPDGSQLGSKIRLVVLDLDGTIVDEANQIHPSVLMALHHLQQSGVQVAIATGRMYQSSLPYYQQVGSQLPIMAYQGAWIQDPATGEHHRHLRLPLEMTHKLLDYFEQGNLRQRISMHLYIDDQLYVREILPETQVYARRSRVKAQAVSDFREVLTGEPTKILTQSEEPDLMPQLFAELRQIYSLEELYLTQSTGNYFEIAHPIAHKGEAVRYVAEELLGLSSSQVMAIGDNFNDREMLAYAGIGVAMGNAPDEVKQIADWVAPSIAEHGVITAMQHFLGLSL